MVAQGSLLGELQALGTVTAQKGVGSPAAAKDSDRDGPGICNGNNVLCVHKLGTVPRAADCSACVTVRGVSQQLLVSASQHGLPDVTSFVCQS